MKYIFVELPVLDVQWEAPELLGFTIESNYVISLLALVFITLTE